MLLRLEHVTITSKTVAFRPLGLVAAFVSSTCGALIYLQSRSRIGRALALLAITAASWVPMLFSLGLLAMFNLAPDCCAFLGVPLNPVLDVGDRKS